MILKDRAGREYRVSADVLRKVTLPFEGGDGRARSVMYEMLARYDFEGRVGYGIAEYLVRKV